MYDISYQEDSNRIAKVDYFEDQLTGQYRWTDSYNYDKDVLFIEKSYPSGQSYIYKYKYHNQKIDFERVVNDNSKYRSLTYDDAGNIDYVTFYAYIQPNKIHSLVSELKYNNEEYFLYLIHLAS